MRDQAAARRNGRRPLHPLVGLYCALSHLLYPAWRLVLHRRLARGKEDPGRLNERLGRDLPPRPEGPVLWLHALSVGESLALLPLAETLRRERPDVTILLTTVTRTSAEALARVGVPEGCIHQMLPIDTPGPARRFLDHWSPSALVVTELDLWPVILVQALRRGLLATLVNCRFSDRNARSRRRIAPAFASLLGQFDRILLQDPPSRERLSELGVPGEAMTVLGALKAGGRPLPADPGELAELDRRIGPRHRWLAASAEGRETAQLAEAHAGILERAPDTLLIYAPRHPAEGDEIETLLRGRFPRLARRSRGELPDRDTQVYLADTMGEMGLFYRLAPVTFLGHSLPVEEGAPLRGKNPFEAAALGSAILHGPSVIDFAETYEELDAAGGGYPVGSAGDLRDAVLRARDPAWRAPITEAAAAVVERRRGVVEETARYCLQML